MLRRQISSPNSLFTFETVARLGSFSAAAKELNVTQPAVSHAVNSLESHLGYSLFNRHGRWIELTQNGNKLFRATSTAFNIVGDSLTEIERRQDDFESISISMSPVAVSYWFLPRMPKFKTRFPNVSLTFREYSKDSDQLLGDADLNIRLSNPQDKDMHRWPYVDERILAVCSPQYQKINGSLDQSNTATNQNFLEWRNQRFGFDEFLHATGLQMPETASFTRFFDYSSALQSALLGQGISLAWINESVFQIIKGNLVPACSQVIKTGRRYHILASNLNPMRPIVEEVRDWLIAEMRRDEKKLATILKTRDNLFEHL